MNTVNASTGFSPFELKTGRSPRLLPPLANETNDGEDATQTARALLEKIDNNVKGAQDTLLGAKISQAHHVNSDRQADPEYKVGDRVMLATARRRRDYMRAKDGRVAKFMPRFDGPYNVLEAHPDTSTYRLLLPPSNNPELFPNRELERPGPIVTEDGVTEYFIDKILDERSRGRGKQYLVQWKGYGAESDLWLPRTELLETEALETWVNRERE